MQRHSMTMLLALVLLGTGATTAWAQESRVAALSTQAVTTSPLLDERVSLDVKEVSVSEALRLLHEASDIAISFSPTMLPRETRARCACDGVTLRTALSRILFGTGFDFIEMSGQIVIVKQSPPRPEAKLARGAMVSADRQVEPLPVNQLLTARDAAEGRPLRARESSLWTRLGGGLGSMFKSDQVGSIRGRVTDATTGEPIAAVQVSVSGTALSVVTDDNGTYQIDNVPAGLYTIETQRIGYAASARENVTVADGGTATVDFALEIAALTLDEIVATGVADPTSARRVPFTVARVSRDALQIPAANAVTAIQGKVAGANIVSSPQPGSGFNMVLRSPTSISRTNSPLIVVDGVILASTFDRSSADLDALDIESIEVVKGAAAASLYGSRAANGVIQIRTRRGTNLEEGRTRITVGSEYGRNGLAREIDRAAHHHYRVNDAGQYIDSEGNIVGREDREERPVEARFLDQSYPDPIFDHVEQVFDPGDYSTNSVSIAQNGASTNFYASYVRRENDGVVLAHGGYEMNNVRINLDHRLRSDLSFSLSGYHMRSTRDGVPDGTFLDLIQQAPDGDLLQPDGDGTPYIYQPDPLGVTPNPLYALALQEDTEERARTLASADLRYSPTGWFSLEGNLSYDRSDREQFFFFPRSMKTDAQELVGGNVTLGSGETTALNASLSADFRRSFGDLSTRLTLRGLMEREDYTFFEAEASSLTADGVRDLNAGAMQTVSGSSQEIRADGYFAIAGLDYAGKYIADALVRRDGSSLFGPEERWHTYYRGSLAWRMAEEDWWPFELFDEFKLRYSRGTAGGRPNYADRFETYSFSSGGGILKSTLGNQELKPERSTEQEFGIDAILADRVSVQLNYATVVTEDQLVSVPLPASFGFSSQWQNAGTVEGDSYEATIEAQIIQRPELQWSVGLIADRSRHEITRFDRPCFRTGSSDHLFRCAGETLGTMYGSQFLRDPSELPDGVPADQFQVNDDGVLVWVGAGNDWRDHQWGDASEEYASRTYDWGMPILQYDSTGVPAIVEIGDGNPDMHLGFNTNLRWKGVSLFLLLDSQIGGDVYNRTNQRMYQYFRSGDTDQAGKPQERKKTTDYYRELYAANVINDWFIEDATYLKLREASLRWEIPTSLLESVRLGVVDGLSVFLIGRNLLTFTGYKGFDPEIGTPTSRIDSFDYPQFRTVTAGVELRF